MSRAAQDASAGFPLVDLIRLNTLVVYRVCVEDGGPWRGAGAAAFAALAHAADDVAVQAAINRLRRRVRLVGACWLRRRFGAFALDIVKLDVTRAHGLVADTQCDGQREGAQNLVARFHTFSP